ncbi:hydrogenase subunit MbhD domain-containing protein [Methylocella sp.]|uniref:hydrogenase subunit MbhD domain-containing protein n=1 Tax=Methylocella sp. TaxID=1978226 RepID=UPI003783CB4F
MSLLDALDLGLAALVAATAAWTILTRAAFSAAVGYVAYGLLLALVWVRLSAVDVAIAEAAIGGGVTGVLLIGAARRIGDAPCAAGDRPGLPVRLAAGALCALCALALAGVILSLPQHGPGLSAQVAAHLEPTGVGNPITATLMVFRSFDTLLEKIVLVLAVVGVWSLTPDRFWGGAPGAPALPRRHGALPFLARALPPLGLVVGIHLVWVGKDEPGGAFQGGAVVAAMWLVMLLARVSQAPSVRSRPLRLALIVGPALFVVSGVLGLFTAGAVFAVPEAWSVPLILVVEAFMTLSIAATLPMLVLGPPAHGPAPHAPAEGGAAP